MEGVSEESSWVSCGDEGGGAVAGVGGPVGYLCCCFYECLLGDSHCVVFSFGLVCFGFLPMLCR